MSFTAPVRDQRLLLAAIGEMAGAADAPDAEIVDAVLEGAAAFAEGCSRRSTGSAIRSGRAGTMAS